MHKYCSIDCCNVYIHAPSLFTSEKTVSISTLSRFAIFSTTWRLFSGSSATWSPAVYFKLEPVMSNSMCMQERSPPL